MPRPPLTLPLPLAQAGQVRTLDFEIVEEFGYTLAIRFHNAPPAKAALLDHLPLRLWVELLQLQGREATPLLAEQRTLGHLRSHGENNRTRTLDSIHLLPGQYRLVIKTVLDYPVLQDTEAHLLVGARTFKVALPGKQQPSPKMQKLLQLIKEKQWIDHPETLQPLPKDTRLSTSEQAQLESYSITRPPFSFDGCGANVYLNPDNGQFWIFPYCGEGPSAAKNQGFMGKMPQ